jgi:hypothetical protein
MDPGGVEILSCDGLGRPTRPRVLLQGRLQPWSLSLAHSDRFVLVAFSEDPDLAVGVDVTPIQSSGAGFLRSGSRPANAPGYGRRRPTDPGAPRASGL